MFGTFRLGFGMMRLPKDSEGQVDLAQTCQMVDAFLAAGGCYFDTAHNYIDGRSELAIRHCLTSRYPRDRYILTNKLTSIFIKEPEDVPAVFAAQLEACGVEYFDNYFFHAMRRSYYELFTHCNAFAQVKELKAQGKIRRIGMSFHDSPEFLEEVLQKHPEIEVVQLQFNYADTDNPDVECLACYEICCKYGRPVVVMEPVKGGTLANLPDEGLELVRKVTQGSPASLALRYCAGFENIRMILSGMSNVAQMQDNLATMEQPAPLSASESEATDQLRRIVRQGELIDCTGCRYCTDGCPQEIPIPELFSAFNARKLRRPYQAEGSEAKRCVECGACEGLCPQNLPIRKLLKRVAGVL